MERFWFKFGIFLVAVVLVIQGYVFFREYENTEYADGGREMSEETYLYPFDQLTVAVHGELDDLQLLKNGEVIRRTLSEPFQFEVRENDLIEVKAKANGKSAVIELKLEQGIFDPRYYVDLFDFEGGQVTAGRFIAAKK